MELALMKLLLVKTLIFTVLTALFLVIRIIFIVILAQEMVFVIHVKTIFIGGRNVMILVNFVPMKGAIIMELVLITQKTVLIQLIMDLNVMSLALILILIVNYVIEVEYALNA
jgi:hypothetical protein